MSHQEHGRGDREKYWAGQSELFKKLYQLGVERYIETLGSTQKLFHLGDHTLRCIDERTPGGIHMAGSGILLSLEQAVEASREAQVDSVCSHAECGAAKLYATGKGLDVGDADRYAREWALELAQKLGVPYTGHIEKDALQGPGDLHIARAAYYDGTGKFDSSKIPKLGIDLPPGFVVSRRFLPNTAYAQSETQVSFNIATGDHGFGELITKDTPFMVIPIGDPEDERFSLEALTEELEPLVKESKGRIIISGFSAHMAMEAAA